MVAMEAISFYIRIKSDWCHLLQVHFRPSPANKAELFTICISNHAIILKIYMMVSKKQVFYALYFVL